MSSSRKIFIPRSPPKSSKPSTSSPLKASRVTRRSRAPLSSLFKSNSRSKSNSKSSSRSTSKKRIPTSVSSVLRSAKKLPQTNQDLLLKQEDDELEEESKKVKKVPQFVKDRIFNNIKKLKKETYWVYDKSPLNGYLKRLIATRNECYNVFYPITKHKVNPKQTYCSELDDIIDDVEKRLKNKL